MCTQVWTHPSLNLSPTAQLGPRAGLAHPELRQWRHLAKSKLQHLPAHCVEDCLAILSPPGQLKSLTPFSICVSVSAAAYLFTQAAAGKASSPSLSGWLIPDVRSSMLGHRQIWGVVRPIRAN